MRPQAHSLASADVCAIGWRWIEVEAMWSEDFWGIVSHNWIVKNGIQICGGFYGERATVPYLICI